MGEVIIKGGGFTLWTADPVMIAVVQRCAELETELHEARHQEVARYRTLRRDVTAIKKSIAAWNRRTQTGGRDE